MVIILEMSLATLVELQLIPFVREPVSRMRDEEPTLADASDEWYLSRAEWSGVVRFDICRVVKDRIVYNLSCHRIVLSAFVLSATPLKMPRGPYFFMQRIMWVYGL